MTYEEYLFAQLLALYSPDFANLEYDYQYPEAILMYKEFEQSPFNADTTGIYQCITNFLQYKYPQYINQ
jgi:hypothetical protein